MYEPYLNQQNNKKKEPTIFDKCYKEHKFTEACDCSRCPHRNKCSYFSEMSFRK